MVADASLSGAAHAGELHHPRYDVIVGSGGIGSGISVRLEGDHILGREESRPVTMLEGRDYCKLHIVFHYLQLLVGDEVRILPVGKVGDDAAGSRLIDEMEAIGLDLGHVTTAPGRDTLYSVAFSYPNGEGGNLTTKHSASDDVTPADIRATESELARSGQGIAVALPEVPLAARRELLRMGGELRFLRVATFVSSEAALVSSSGMLADVDLLVLNADEAAALAGAGEGSDPGDLVLHSVERLLAVNDRLSIVVTAGVSGSWCWDGETISHAPAIPARVRSTAGAGDSHLAGILSGLARGSGLHESNRFASLISSMKVASPHTINPTISWTTVEETATQLGFRLPVGLRGRQNGDR